MQAKALNYRGFHGFSGLLLLLAASVGWSQVIDFVPFAPSVYESGGPAGTSISIGVTRSSGTGTSIVEYATFDGSATQNFDYIPTNGVLTFLDGETLQIIKIPIIDDAAPQPPHTFGVLLLNPSGATLGTNNPVIVTIFDNDEFFRFSTITNFVSEDETNVVLTVQRIGDSTGAASVDYHTINGAPGSIYGPAIAGVAGDYASSSGTILFSNGQTTATVTIPINDDCIIETNEYFLVQLDNPIGGYVSATAGLGTVIIDDNDYGNGRLRIIGVKVVPSGGNPDPGDPLFSNLRPFVRENNTRQVIVDVLRECGTTGQVTIDITNAPNVNAANCPGGDSALINQDYTISPRTLTWPANNTAQQAVQSFTIDIVDDDLVELDETVNFSLVRARLNGTNFNALLGTVTDIDLVIRSDDNPAGSVMPGYNTPNVNNPTPGANSEVYAIAYITNSQAGNNGKAIIVGDFTGVNSVVRNRIARLTTTGALDQSFNPGSGADGFADAIALQPNGKILVGGGFTSVDNISRVGIARLNEDGSLDNTFVPGTGFNGPVTAITLQTNGMIVVAGDFTSYNNVPVSRVARLFNDGTLDTSFNVGLGPDAVVWAIGNIGSNSAPSFYIVGEFRAVNGTARHGVARLANDGSLDAAFDPPFGADAPVYALCVQPNGRLIVGGSFQTFDGESRPGIVRLMPDGSNDGSFNPGTGVHGAVYDIKLQDDGLPVIGGSFDLYNGTSRSNVARIYIDGTLDTSFLDVHYNQAQPGADGFVNSLSVQTNGDILAGGSFRLVGGGNDIRGGMLTNQVRAQFNFTRFAGGPNPGDNNLPGNVEFTSAQYSVDELSLSGNVTLTVRRINGTVGPLRVTYFTGDGTAVAGTDYDERTSDVTWLNCDQGTATFSVPINDNTFVQGNRTFTITLTNPVSLGGIAPAYPALGAQTKATITIIDNDFNYGVIGFSQPIFTVDEPAGNVVVTVTRTNGSVGQVFVDYATYDLKATNGISGDYTAVSGTLTFGSGQTNKTITIPIFNDLNLETEEWFGIRLTNVTGGATLGLGNAAVVINDNDFGFGSVSFANLEYSAGEGNGNAIITLHRGSGGLGTLAVDFSTYDLALGPGFARGGIDYTQITQRVYFSNGVYTQYVSVPLVSDTFVEGNERLGLLLSNVTGGSLGFITNAVLNILDDDAYGRIGFGDVNYFVSERGTNAVIAVFRTDGDSEDVAVDYATVGGSATPGADYVATNGTLTFLTGQRTNFIVIPILDDVLLEGNEAIGIVLNNFLKASPGDFTSALLTIVDDEALHVPAGDVDTTFEAFPTSFVNALGLQSNGKLVIGGDFTTINHFGYNRIARLTITGTIDPLFKVGRGANNQIQAILVQPDDKIIIGGLFTTYDTTNRARIARLNSDGTIDSSFNPGAGTDNPVFALALTADRRVVLGGSFTTVNGITRPNIAVLNTNGSVDLTFNTGAGVNGTVYAVAVQPDGKILIGGDFTVVNNTNRARIARLNADGSLDLTFNPGTGAQAAVRAIALQIDGGIVIGGSFTNYNGASRNYLTRLLPGGTLDPSFDVGSGADAAVLALSLQGNGKIVAVGDFHVFNGVNRNRITRLNPSGSTDQTINFGTGANSFIAAVLIQANEQIVIGGGFTEFNGVPRNYVARLVGGENYGAGTFNFLSQLTFTDENGTNCSITVLRQGGMDGTATVHVATFDGSAIAPDNYTAVSTTLSFQPGESLQTFAIGLSNNTRVDGDLVLFASLDSPSAGADLGLQKDAVIVIREDDAVIGFTTENFSVNEGAAGGHATVTLSRSALSSTNSTVAVTVTASPGSATDGADFAATSNLVVFAPGELVKEFVIPVFEDALVEGPETILLGVSDPQVVNSPQSSAYLGLSSATLTIVDNDFLPGQFTFTALTNSVDEFAAFATVTVLRTNGSSGIVSVHYALADGTAISGQDYITTSGTLSFADGETAKSFSFLILNDQLVEGDESLGMVLSNPTGGATLGTVSNGVMVIVDDESGVHFESATYAVAEDDQTVRLTVVRSGNTNVSAFAGFSTVNGTATAPADYFSTNGQLVFGPGETSKSFDVTVIPDIFVEGTETFAAVLSNPSPNVQIGYPSNAVVTIQDSARFVQFEGGTYFVGEGDTNAAITIIRTGLLTRGISVFVRTVDGTATAGLDYLAYSNIVKFAAGESNKTILIPIIDDGLTEPNETVTLELLFPTNAAIANPSTAELRILDNDPGPGFSDTGFNVGLGANRFVRSVALQADGKVLVGGAFTNFAGVTNRNYLVRVSDHGVYDPSFDVGTGPNALVSAIGYTPDNHIVIAGAFTNVNGSNYSRVARLNTNGGFDLTFIQPPTLDAAANTLAIQPDNRIVIGGGFSTPTRGIARLRVNGTRDLTFDVSGGADSLVYAAKIQQDGYILVGGAFTNVGGFNYPRLVRLGTNGLVDVTFAPLAITNGIVYSIAVGPDGKPVIAGSFRSINGVARSGVARLNTDGTLDLSFDPGSGVNGTVYTVNCLINGEVFIGGDFTSINGFPCGRYALLSTNGSQDTVFEASMGADSTVYSSVVQPDQKIIIGGDFTLIAGVTNRGVARLNVGDILSGVMLPIRLGMPRWAADSANFTVTTMPGCVYVLDATTDLSYPWTALSTNTATGTSSVFIDPNTSGNAHRYYRVRRIYP